MISPATIRRRLNSRRAHAAEARRFTPPDPRVVVAGPLDPELERIRTELRPHVRRLWLRRFVRRAFITLAVVIGAELLLWTLARVTPIELAPAIAVAIPFVGLLGLIGAAVLARPSLGETAIAVDSEGHLGDRVTSALALAAAVPSAAGPTPDDESDPDRPLDDAGEERRFVRRQRHDALKALRTAPANLFRPRFSRSPAAGGFLAAVLLVPILLVPNPQDIRIADLQRVREEAARQADRIDDIAEDLESEGADANDPRTQLAKELRELAQQLRDRPGDLDLNLAKLGTLEGNVRAQLDPANEQRASALTTLSRALSRTATGSPTANQDGDPKETKEDLKDLGEKLDEMTPEERRELARQLTEQQSTASQADGAAGQALRDAAQSLGQGDTAGARAALDRLGEALENAEGRVDVNRDLASAASRLQDARRNLANAGQQGQQGQGQQGQGQQGEGQQGRGQQGQQGQQGQGQQGQGQQGQGGQGQGQQGQGGQGQGGQGQGQGGQGQGGQGQGQGGQGQGGQGGQGQGQGGSLGGGGSNATHLGTGSSSGMPGMPVNPNRLSELGEDLASVFAPFDRVGQPGDPSYVAGTGGDGQSQQGNNSGQGIDNGSYVPYQDVFTTFEDFAMTSLERNYIPLSVKDFVRDYFSSLDPSN